MDSCSASYKSIGTLPTGEKTCGGNSEGGGTTAANNLLMNVTSAWCRRAQIPHRGDTSGTPRTFKGVFSAYTQALRDRDLPEEDIRVLSKIIPDFLFDLRGAGEAFEDIKQMGLSA